MRAALFIPRYVDAFFPEVGIATLELLERLPRFMMYNRLNAWGRQREVPEAPQLTFRQGYLENRGKR